MGIEALYVSVVLKAAAGQFGKKIMESILSYPLMDRLKSLVPMSERDTVENFILKKATEQDVELIRKHLTDETNQTQEFKTLVRDSFNLSDGDVQLFLQHLKAYNDNLSKHQKLVDQHGRAGVATEGDYRNMMDHAGEKMSYHEEEALKLLELRK